MTPFEFKKRMSEQVDNIDVNEAIESGFQKVMPNLAVFIIDNQGYVPKFGRDSVQRVIQNVRRQLSTIANQIESVPAKQVKEEFEDVSNADLVEQMFSLDAFQNSDDILIGE